MRTFISAEARVWLDPKAPPDEVESFLRTTNGLIAVRKDRGDCKIYVGDHFAIPSSISAFDELMRSGSLRPVEGIESPDKQFFEVATL